jgi:HAD superfamily hydrolase (TIGR01549 family)
LVGELVSEKIFCKAVLFDLWDTLAQADGITKRTQEKLGLSGMPFSDFIKRFEKAFMTKRFSSFGEAFAGVFKEFGLQQEDDLMVFDLEKTWRAHIESARLFPDALPVLKALKQKGFRLGLVSNCQWFQTRELLQRLGLSEFFDGISFSFEVGSLKPEPKIFQDCLRQVNAFPNEAVMVGDSPTDVAGAVFAGMRGIFLDRSALKESPTEATATVHSLKDLLKLLELPEGGW